MNHMTYLVVSSGTARQRFRMEIVTKTNKRAGFTSLTPPSTGFPTATVVLIQTFPANLPVINSF